jgi:nucleoside-diphosphate-sugar epimerase
MKTVLVTGASGFIGGYTTPLLVKEGYTVLAPPHSELDLFDFGAVESYCRTNKPELLIHLAWKVNRTALENTRWFQASKNLFRHFYHSGGEQAIAMGSGLEYDPAFGYMNEDFTPHRPDNLYGVAKYYTGSSLARIADANGGTFTWARLFYTFGYGKWETRLMPDLIKNLLQNKPVMVRNPNFVGDYLYVKDVASIIVKLIERNVGVINVCSGRPVSMKEVAEYIGAKIGNPDNIAYDFTTPSGLYIGDNSKLQGLGITPKYTLEQGLDETIAMWKERQCKTTL